jgi:4-hydroxyproline epimerase
MRVIDSHTGGMPTRVIIEGGPDLGHGPLSERRRRFAEQFDVYRRRAVLEPKCSDAMVGALLCEPEDPEAAAGVIFFNTTGYLGMCGHGTIGLAATLAWLGRLDAGHHVLETPVGPVDLEWLGGHTARFENVEAYCLKPDVELNVPGVGRIRGDIAWGGNWFFLTDGAPCALVPDNIAPLTEAAWAIRHALVAQGLSGADGVEIDHVEFFGPPGTPGAHGRNFVLCPGGAYDRSPCGTGTSAKLACLAHHGKLAPGQPWIQESIIGSRFTGTYRPGPRGIIPTISGEAFVFADTRLVEEADDPFRDGIGS